MKAEEKSDWYTPQEVADLLSVNAKWVRAQIAQGVIPAVRIGRRMWVTKEGLEDLKGRFTTTPAKATEAPQREVSMSALLDYMELDPEDRALFASYGKSR